VDLAFTHPEYLKLLQRLQRQHHAPSLPMVLDLEIVSPRFKLQILVSVPPAAILDVFTLLLPKKHPQQPSRPRAALA
jgi:hypothetical protein